VVINPNNPTGAVYPREILQSIIDIACEHQLIVFSDEIYDRIIYDGLHHTAMASLSDDLLFITLGGLSKTHRIAGFRVGWMVISGKKAIAKDYIDGLNILASMRLCSNVPAQFAVQTALGGYQSINDLIKEGGRLREQRDFIHRRLNEIPGMSCTKPKGAFYVFPKLDQNKFNIKDDQQFVLDFLLREKVLLVQGTGFNWHNPDHFRIVFLPNMEDLELVIERLTRFLADYRQ
jgi:alanine-synthesizing transaminase